jgi:tetratricopeptide (TPR) repeat protein
MRQPVVLAALAALTAPNLFGAAPAFAIPFSDGPASASEQGPDLAPDQAADQAADRQPEPAAPTPLELPAFDAAKMEPGLARLLDDARARALATLADPAAAPATKAAAIGSLGQTYQAFDLLEAAAACYREAARLVPGERKWRYLVATLDYEFGRYEEARRRLEAILAGDPPWTPARTLLGLTHLELGEPERARTLLLEALDGAPDDAIIHLGLGRAEAALERPEAAVERFRRALELQPRASSVHYALARELLKLGRREEADAHLRLHGEKRVAFSDPYMQEIGDIKALIAFQVVHQMAADPGERPEEQILRFALSYLGDLKGTVEAFEQILTRPDLAGAPAPQRATLHYVTAGVALRQGLDEPAERHLRAAVELDPGLADARVQLGNLLALRGDFAAAGEQFTGALDERPGDATILVKRATAALNAGDAAAAIRDLEAALAAAPSDLEARIRLAQARGVGGDPAAADAELAKLLASTQDPAERARAHRAWADLRRRREDYAGAIEQLRQALAAAPTDSESRLDLARLLGHTGDFAAAAEAFDEVLAEWPDHAAALQGRAIALVLLERYAEAASLLADAVERRPSALDLALLLARLRAAAPDPAVRNARQALALAARLEKGGDEATEADDVAGAGATAAGVSVDPVLADTLALAQAAAGNFEEAIAWQEKALAGGAGSTAPPGAADRLELYRRQRPFVAGGPTELLPPPGSG